MGTEIPDTQWEESLEHIHKCSNNARHCLIQRLHYSKERLHRIYPEFSPTCVRCLPADDTLLHSFVLCPKVKTYCFNIFSLISKILHIQLETDPFIIILGTSDDVIKLSNFQKCFLSYSLIIAKKLPTTKMWLSDLTNTLHLERIRYTLMDKLAYFEKMWSPLTHYVTPPIRN